MKYYVVDAFADRLFSGNPAGVCVLDGPMDSALMQSIAFENNLAETAFFYPDGDVYRLKWFTPVAEIDLCGHATLASAYVVMRFVEPDAREVRFETLSGRLTVTREGEVLTLNFPSRRPVPCAVPEGLEKALGVKILEAHSSRDMLCLVESEAVLKSIRPDYQALAAIHGPLGFVVTAKGDTYDFVSRFFAPNTGIDEDPVTGSTHTNLIPFWSERLGKTKMTAAQLSSRGGVLYCENCGERVKIGGTAVCYLQGELLL
ncbi:MAG TPA: PhzF family phenazine biosynthesis protein [Candidatus Limiplasma sp.]|nr:PhzF family phenazine biosynthesis protein [Candidatus Limiplasma sp.]HRX08307.1 PhzF family phenazine biosynthesis protein [Candidatus Limiplasma sp.]